KVEVGGHELTFVDERRSGSTQFVKAFTPATAAGPPKAGAKPPAIGVTGGRVVSLTDGREYVIAAAPLLLGREAGCDVVVPGPAAGPPAGTPSPAAAARGSQRVGGSGQAAPEPGAGGRLRRAVHGLEVYVPPSPRSPAGGSLASFLVRSGGLAGQRLTVKEPAV